MSTITKILSYPPEFRPARLLDPVKHHPYKLVDHPNPLPVIDMACFDKARLHVACSDWGIFRVVNHGIPEELIALVQESAKSSFDLPFETKREIFTKPNPVYNWGNKALSPNTPANRPEVGFEVLGFSVVGADDCGDDGDEIVVTSLRHALKEYGEHVTQLARKIFKAMTSNLKLDLNIMEEGCVDKYLDKSSAILRAHRYLPYSTFDTNAQIIGFGPHTDSSTLTILLQDDVSGLEVCKDDGLWVPVKPIPNTLIVNPGDMIQAMSNDEYKSAVHQVKLNEDQERISVIYLVFPEESTTVMSSKGKYRPFTFKEFRAQIQEDVAKNGTKFGLSHFLA